MINTFQLQDDRLYPESWGEWFREKMKAKAERMPTDTFEYEIERMKIAGALIAAEIDRLNNL